MESNALSATKPSSTVFDKVATESIEEEKIHDKAGSDESDSPIAKGIALEESKGPQQQCLGPVDVDLTEDSVQKPSLRILVGIVQRNSLKELSAIMGGTRTSQLQL